MQKIKVTIRRDRETKRPILFFVNQNARGYWIECYDRIGQHSQASGDYLRACAPMPELDDAARALVREWAALGEPCEAQPVARLTYPRGAYLGN